MKMRIFILAGLFMMMLLTTVSGKEFGHNFLADFTIEPGYRNLNMGSFGFVPKAVQTNVSEWRNIMERNPDRFFRYTKLDSLYFVLQKMASFLNVRNWQDLVFIRNTSEGVNAALRSLAHKQYKDCRSGTSKQCTFLYFDTAFSMVKSTLSYISDTWGDSIKLLEFTVSTAALTDDEQMLKELNHFLKTHDPDQQVYMVAISEITAVPAVVFNVKRITQFFHERNALVIVDAAHTMGAIPLDIGDLNPDIWVTNGYKWLYAPRGSGVMYVNETLQHLISPTVIVGGKGDTPFQSAFISLGCDDYTPWLAMNAALEFREAAGGDSEIISYINKLGVEARDYLASFWGTSVLTGYDKSYGALINVEIPTNQVVDMQILTENLFNPTTSDYHTILPFFEWKGKLYARISCQIFNQMSDYVWFGNRVKEILANPTLSLNATHSKV